MRDLTIASSQIELAVRDFGGRGDPILLLHGLGRTLVDWSIIGPLLAGHRRTVAFDLRGHGKSGDGLWSWEAALSDIDAVATELELERPAVAGHSLGGMLAIMWARSHAEVPGVINIDGHGLRKLSQYDGIDAQDAMLRVARADERVKASLAALSGPLPSAVVDGLISQQQALAIKLGAPVEMFVESIARTLRTENGFSFLRPSPAGIGKEILADAEATDMLSIYPTVGCPVLVVAGTDPDPGTDQELMTAYRSGLKRDLKLLAESQPNVKVEFVRGGHGLLFEQPENLASLITRFLGAKTAHQ